MTVLRYSAFVLLIATASAYDPVIRKLDDVRFQHVASDDGQLHLVDMWMKASDLAVAARYNPDLQNVYHLYTRENPRVSQPFVLGSGSMLQTSNYNPQRRTIILIHGWLQNVVANVNTVLVPAFLEAEDVNVFVVDWSAGAEVENYFAAVANNLESARSVARFIDWLNMVSGIDNSKYHIVGFGFGGHQAGMAGRFAGGDIAYITGLDPSSAGYILNSDRFQETDGVYTEVIHTSAGVLGYLGPLAQCDFYPNGGVDMPGCTSSECDHNRAFHYFAESLTSGGFTGERCLTYIAAMTNNCRLSGTLNMGGIKPKTGHTGIYRMRTNIFPPFSRD